MLFIKPTFALYTLVKRSLLIYKRLVNDLETGGEKKRNRAHAMHMHSKEIAHTTCRLPPPNHSKLHILQSRNIQ